MVQDWQDVVDWWCFVAGRNMMLMMECFQNYFFALERVLIFISVSVSGWFFVANSLHPSLLDSTIKPATFREAFPSWVVTWSLRTLAIGFFRNTNIHDRRWIKGTECSVAVHPEPIENFSIASQPHGPLLELLQTKATTTKSWLGNARETARRQRDKHTMLVQLQQQIVATRWTHCTLSFAVVAA